MRSNNNSITPVNWDKITIFNTGIDQPQTEMDGLYMPSVDGIRSLLEDDSTIIEKYVLDLLTGIIQAEMSTIYDHICNSENILDIQEMSNQAGRLSRILTKIKIKVSISDNSSHLDDMYVYPINWNMITTLNESGDDTNTEELSSLFMPLVYGVRNLINDSDSTLLIKILTDILTGTIKGEILTLSQSIDDTSDIDDIIMMGKRISVYSDIINKIKIKASIKG